MSYLKSYIHHIIGTCKQECNGEVPTLIKTWKYRDLIDTNDLMFISLCIDERNIIDEFLILNYNDYLDFIYHNRFDIADELNMAFPGHCFIPCFVDEKDLDCDPGSIIGFIDLKNVRYIIENDINLHGFIDIFVDQWRTLDTAIDILVRPIISKRIIYHLLIDDLIKMKHIDECSRFIIMIIQYLNAAEEVYEEKPDFSYLIKSVRKYLEMQLDDTYKLEMEISSNPFTGRFIFMDPF